jgi:hypothetical protein
VAVEIERSRRLALGAFTGHDSACLSNCGLGVSERGGVLESPQRGKPVSRGSIRRVEGEKESR